MIPRFLRGRPTTLVAVLSTCVLSLLQPACQDGEVANTQVCAFQCDYTDANAALTAEDVVQVIANALFEARANGITDVTVVVLDHLSNVLAVFDSDASTTNYSLITSVESPNRTTNSPWIVENNGGLGADFTESSAPGTAEAFQSLQTALDGVFIPAGYAAISKAGTANYFSTQGNAFSSRTASVLIQQNFFPGETDRPGGPLFDVQIAQLACSDINTRQSVNQITDTTVAPDPTDLIGPRRLPVGFAGDPGGIPLYKDGVPDLTSVPVRTGKVVVGAVGVEFNGIYSVDKDGTDNDRNLEERIAVGATRGFSAAESFEADDERKASRITVAGRALRFADDDGTRGVASGRPQITAGQAASGAAATVALNAVSGETGAFVTDTLFFPFADPRAGVNFLTPQSGVIAATLNEIGGGGSNGFVGTANGEILVDAAATPRYPAIRGVNPLGPLPANAGAPAPADGLSAADVQELLIQSLLLAEQTRAQTRRPLGGQARIDVAVVDLDGNVVGFARSQDALLDGVDVTIAKTRQAAFFSKQNAQAQLQNAVDPLGTANLLNVLPLPTYVNNTAGFLEGLTNPPPTVNDPPFNGAIAWSSAALGGIAGRDFPPGVASGPNGPLARDPDLTTTTAPRVAPTDFGEWSIFSTGIQTELVLPGIALGLCEEVPDLANVLFQVNAALALGATTPAGAPASLFTSAADRGTFCGSIRTILIGSADPGAQLDCMQGVQDGGANLITGLQNGYHQFQGAFPIYRAGNLIGAIGVSGDGAEQDDFVPFVALDEVGKAQAARGLVNPIGNAPFAVRADNVSVFNVNLRYAVCPPAPYLTSNEQNGCEGR